MNLAILTSRKELNQHVNDPYYNNSFFFWMLAARLYPKEVVRIATSLNSSMALLIVHLAVIL